MTSRTIRYSSRDDDERTKLLNTGDDQDEYEIRFSNEPYEYKKRSRKHSDEISSYALVDIGNVPNAPPPDQCVEAEVQPGDTLASLSLKYNIPVSELKRVNNIVSENHFYALKRIKIPVKAASLLTEILPSVHEAKGESKLDNGWYVREVPSPIQTGGTSSTVPSTPPSDGEHEIVVLNGDISEYRNKDLRHPEGSKQTKKAKKFLRNVDKDLARIKERLDVEEDDEENEVDANEALMTIQTNSESGAKYGFVDSIRDSKSRTACCLFIVIISVVVIFILIFAHEEFGVIEKHHPSHHKVKSHHQ